MTEEPQERVDQAALQRSPLHVAHDQAGAKFASFAGWQMPLEYTGIVAEHNAVRTSVGIFDVSHLGTTLVRGPGAVAALNRILTNDLDRIGPGQAQYTLLCTPEGDVVDDLIAYVFGPDDVLLIPNAGNAARVNSVIAEMVGNDIEVIDAQQDTAIIAVQGPRSRELLGALGLPTDLAYMAVARSELMGVEVVVCRTGYTGELGFELLIPAADAVRVWEALLTAGGPLGVLPCGLGSRDTLRTEMGYPLHGQDLGGGIGPVAARLNWAIGWDKPEFRGREAIVQSRHSDLQPRLRGLVLLERGVPRPGVSVHLEPSGPSLGTVTSGTFSPTLKTGIALALLEAGVSDGDEVVLNVRGRMLAARVTPPPFVAGTVRD